MKRRLLALVLSCAMALSLTACGGSKDAATTAPAEGGDTAAADADKTYDTRGRKKRKDKRDRAKPDQKIPEIHLEKFYSCDPEI